MRPSGWRPRSRGLWRLREVSALGSLRFLDGVADGHSVGVSVMTVLASSSGDAAEWVAAVGTTLAFGATSIAVWAGHRLRLEQHREQMFDEALKVTVDVLKAQSRDPTLVTTDKINTTLLNGGRRQITDVKLFVFDARGAFPQVDAFYEDAIDFLQAGHFWSLDFDGPPGVTEPRGVRPTSVFIQISFTDFDGTAWHKLADGRLLREPASAWGRFWWRRRNRRNPPREGDPSDDLGDVIASGGDSAGADPSGGHEDDAVTPRGNAQGTPPTSTTEGGPH